MNKVVVTGSRGFIGKNLMEALMRKEDAVVAGFDLDDDPVVLGALLKDADIVYHLAGVNRPEDVREFENGNTGFTGTIVSLLMEQKKKPGIVMTSSIQAALDNPYGVSKKRAEDILFEYGRRTGAPVYVYRLVNVFGKWCRPNYNSVVATFCHNISHDLDITISDRDRELELVYIDDVVTTFLSIPAGEVPGAGRYLAVHPKYTITLGCLADKIYQLRDVCKTLVIPDISDDFMKRLYATYLSYLDEDGLSYSLDLKIDNRGSLAELFKSEHFGQIFVSKTHAGVVRGNHYHNTKIEKFCVIQGEALISLRHIRSDVVQSYRVSGEKLQVVDIPPGHTHSIENISNTEMIALFWANQIFDPEHPDTYHCEVERA